MDVPYLLRCLVLPGIAKAALSRALQHQDTALKLSALTIESAILTKADGVLAEMGRRKFAESWRKLRGSLLQELPDLQVLLAMRLEAMSEGNSVLYEACLRAVCDFVKLYPDVRRDPLLHFDPLCRFKT